MNIPKEALANLRLVAFDIDGVFTDGRFYLSNVRPGGNDTKESGYDCDCR